jgi:putative transposase
LWHVDLTAVPTSAGFWASWCPWALPQCWPFCWCLAVVLRFLGRVVARVGRAARHLVTDQGEQFHCTAFQRWCRAKGMRQRFGAVGKSGSIAVVERFLRTLKQESTRVVAVVPLLRRALCRELQLYASWYNAARPHTTLAGATPDEVYFGRRPACRMPRFEPRPAWPRGSPCAKPQVLVKGQPGVVLDVMVNFQSGRRHLPRIILNRAA